VNAHPSQLFVLLFNEGKIEQLARALEQTRERLETAGEGDVWRFWRAAMLAARGDFEDAEAAAATLPEAEKSEAQRIIVLSRAQKFSDWGPAVQFFQQRWERTHEPADLFALCEVQLSAGNPAFVAEHAFHLVDAVRTPAALRLAVNATSAANRWQDCLQLLDTYSTVFPNASLPAELRRLRIIAEQNIGMLTEAAQHAEDLVRDESSAENVALLFQLRVTAGQLKEATLPAKRLIDHPETPPDTLAQVGWVMRLEDRAIAEAALRKAVEKGVGGPESVAMMAVLAHELEVTDLLPALSARMADAARTPNRFLRAADIAEIVSLQNETAKRSHEALEHLRGGRVPVHVLRGIVGAPLAASSIIALSHKGSPGELSPHAAVFFRHGGRRSVTQTRGVRRLYVDVTSYVNAHELGLLPIVERAFGPLIVPSALRSSLVQQLDDSNKSQPDWDKARNEVLSFIATEKIEVWESVSETRDEPLLQDGLPSRWWAALELVKNRGGILVDYWPKFRDDHLPFVPAEEHQPFIVTPVSLVNVLHREGVISEAEARTARSELGPLSGMHETMVEIGSGKTIFLVGNLVETLAHAGLLGPLAQKFRVVMDSIDVGWVRREKQVAEWRRLVGERLHVMLDHLAASPSAYAELTLQKTPTLPHENRNPNAAEFCLMQLLQSPAGEGHFVWLDERYLNAYERCGEVPIITTLGIIEELRQVGHISTVDYFSYRHRLRSADFRYIPLQPEELLFHLQRAAVVEQQVKATPELEVTRRYLASGLLDKGSLQLPPLTFQSPKPAGELELLLSTTHALADSLVGVFADSSLDVAVQRARADWLLRSLWLVPEHYRHILGAAEEASEEQTRAKGAGDSILLGKLIDRNSFSGEDGRQRYAQWLGDTLLLDSDRQQAAADHVTRTLETGEWADGTSELERGVKAGVMASWYLALPETVRERVSLSTKTRQLLHLQERQAITVGGRQFEAAAFWRAAAEAYRKKNAKFRYSKSEPPLTLRIDKGPSVALLVEGVQPTDKRRIEDDSINLLADDEQKRLKFLAEHPEWFDDISSNSATHSKIAKESNVAKRIARLERVRASSGWHHYKLLERQSRRKKGPTLDELAPPPWHVLRSYLRIDASNKNGDQLFDWEATSAELIHDVGIEETFLRIGVFPRLLPKAFLEAFDALSPPRRRKTVQALQNSTVSVLARIQLFRLMLRINKRGKAVHTVGEELLADSALTDAEALLRAVRWSWNRLGDAEQAGDQPALRLLFAWVHGNRLFEILRPISDADTIRGFFSRYDVAPRREYFVAAQGESDVAWPRNVNALSLLLAGVSSAMHSEGADADGFTGLKKAAHVRSFERTGDVMWPKIELLYDPASFGNVLGSFLGDARDVLFVPPLGAPASALSTARMQREIDALLTSFEDGSAKEASWTLLGILLRGRPCPEAFRPRLRAILENTDFLRPSFDQSGLFAAVLAAASQAWAVGGAELASAVGQTIGGFAAWLRDRDGEGEDETRRQMLLQCIVALARATPASHAIPTFVETALAAWRQWPRFGSTLTPLLPLMLSLPHDQLSDCWPFILQLRRSAAAITETRSAAADAALDD
jgi:hypothetical protein